MKYLIDTNICIYLIKQQPKTLINHLKTFRPEDIAISSITIAELEYGVAKSRDKDKNRVALNKFLIPYRFVDFNSSAASYYGQIRQDLEAKGKIIGSMDLLIAAIALANKMILVTNNQKEFKRVSSLKIENWV